MRARCVVTSDKLLGRIGGHPLKSLKIVLLTLCAIGVGSIATTTLSRISQSPLSEAHAQSISASPLTAGAATTWMTFRDVPAFATSPGVSVLITNNVSGESSLNFYILCVPGAKLPFKSQAQCPSDGIFVTSKILCEGAAAGSPGC